MTEQKSLKRRVRARMSKTGERYTAARRQILARSPQPPAIAYDQLGQADDVLRQRTGRGWAEWIAQLNAWGAFDRTHTAIAAWLRDEHRVEGWWAQSITVGYERATGRRAIGQTSGGFAVSVSRTVGVPVERLRNAIVDERQRSHWLPDAVMQRRRSTAADVARFDWEDGPSRLVAHFAAKGDARSVVTLQHERLPDAAAAQRMKLFWRERADALKGLLEA